MSRIEVHAGTSTRMYVRPVGKQQRNDGRGADHSGEMQRCACPDVIRVEVRRTFVAARPVGCCGCGGATGGEEEFGDGEIVVVRCGVEECPAVGVGDVEVGGVGEQG